MPQLEITQRQSILLRRVIETHVELGHPVGSKWLAEHAEVPWGPSTIRAELARLEDLGLLSHPHPSAGRVPTDRGYREYVDGLLESGELPAETSALDLSLMRREVDEAMRATTEQLSQVTNLLAIVSAPPIATTTIRHIEVLLLQPQVAMVVVITSTGGVSKRVVSYDQPVDPGLVSWAHSYLNEVLVGMGLGARMLHKKLQAPDLGDHEREFLATLAPAFIELEDTAEESLFVGGTDRLLSEERLQELSQINDLMKVLERRVSLLRIFRHPLQAAPMDLRVGHQHQAPGPRSPRVAAAPHGLAPRPPGAVGAVG